MNQIDLTIAKGAIFSEDRKYRYALWRIWNPNRKMLLSISLNPSKAGVFNDDPTVTRDISRAYRNGFGGLFKANLYPLVSTDPNELLKNELNVELDNNDYYLREMIRLSGLHLVGWGSFKPVKFRAPQVLAMIPEPYCLGVNMDGQPKHPLYVGYDVPMKRYQVVVKNSIL